MASKQNLEYVYNYPAYTLTGILYGIKANQEVLQRIEDNTSNQTQALEQQADIQEEQINEIYHNITLKIDNFTNDIISNFSDEYLLNTNKIITELKIKKENDYINKFNNFILKIFENIKVDNKERFIFFFEDENIKFNLFLDKICNNKTILYTYIKNRIINHLDTIKKEYNTLNKITLQDKILMCDELYNLDNVGKLSILFFNKKNYYKYYNKLI